MTLGSLFPDDHSGYGIRGDWITFLVVGFDARYLASGLGGVFFNPFSFLFSSIGLSGIYYSDLGS